MYDKPSNFRQPSMFFGLEYTLNPKHPLYRLANKINRQRFEDAFSPLYCSGNGHPTKPVPLMVGLVILRHLCNISDEGVVAHFRRMPVTGIFATIRAGHKKAVKADRKLRTIASRLVLELDRNLSASRVKGYEELLSIFYHILGQKRDTKNKVYFIHEPEVECTGKGKEHKKYEFGNKVSIARTGAD